MTDLFKTKPFAHQLHALELSDARDAFAWFMDMGTGKSKVFIDECARIYLEGKIDGVLIIANKGSYLNWEETQIPTHLYEGISRRVFTWTASKALRLSNELPEKFNGLTILVMNVEALISDKAQVVAECLLKHKKCIMVVDESTTIKNIKAQRTKAAIALGRLAVYRRIMTGDPINKDPLDLWGQTQFLGGRLLGHTSYFSFRACYANIITMNLGPRSFKKVTGFKNLEELTELIRAFSYRVKKEDCLDLPPKLYEYRYVELTPEQKKAYKDLVDESIAFLNEQQFVTTDIVIKRIMRLHQVVCGSVKADDGTVVRLPNNRLSALMDLLEETEGKVIIWANYTDNIREIENAIAAAYGYSSVVSYFGATNEEDRKNATEQFQSEESDVRFLVSNQKTGGYGNTWTAASTVIYYSNDYDLEKRRQSEDRAHRIGQTKSVTYIDLVAKGTVDEKIIKSLKGKHKVASDTMGDEWKEWLV